MQLAIGCGHEARAVEYKLILPADLVDVYTCSTVSAGECAHQLNARVQLVQLVRRCIQAYDQVRTGYALRVGGTRSHPDVLADAETYLDPVNVDYLACVPGLEVTSFVKHPVVRQVPLMVDCGQLSARRDCGRVV